MTSPKITKCPPGYAYGYCSQGSSEAFDALGKDIANVGEPMNVLGLLSVDDSDFRNQKARKVEDRISRTANYRNRKNHENRN